MDIVEIAGSQSQDARAGAGILVLLDIALDAQHAAAAGGGRFVGGGALGAEGRREAAQGSGGGQGRDLGQERTARSELGLRHGREFAE